MSNARPTIASTNARIDALETGIAAIMAHLGIDEPAKAPAKAPKARKAAPKKAQPKAAPKAKAPTKGSQTRETLTRKEFNRTVTAKARLAGGDTYKRVLAAWDQVTAMRETSTPDEIIALFVA